MQILIQLRELQVEYCIKLLQDVKHKLAIIKNKLLQLMMELLIKLILEQE